MVAGIHQRIGFRAARQSRPSVFPDCYFIFTLASPQKENRFSSNPKDPGAGVLEPKRFLTFNSPTNGFEAVGY
jgi:hypothetical protein